MQVKHEISYWLNYKTLEKKKLVLEKLQQNQLWDDLNKFEKEFSQNYFESLNENALKME